MNAIAAVQKTNDDINKQANDIFGSIDFGFLVIKQEADEGRADFTPIAIQDLLVKMQELKDLATEIEAVKNQIVSEFRSVNGVYAYTKFYEDAYDGMRDSLNEGYHKFMPIVQRLGIEYAESEHLGKPGISKNGLAMEKLNEYFAKTRNVDGNVKNNNSKPEDGQPNK